MLALAFILAGLTFSGAVRPGMILALAFALGIANAFDAPARQALVLELVPREDLSNAVALNSTMFNLATVIGPALGGITYALVGPTWCFAINGISFLAVIAALGLIRPAAVTRPSRSSLGKDLREGIRYVASHSTTWTLVLVSGVAALLGQAPITLLPAWSVTVLHGNAVTNGWLQSARGLGCVLGALMIASLARFRFKGRLLTVGTVVFPLFIVSFSSPREFVPAFLAMAGMGWSMMVLFNMVNSILLGRAAEAMRGRVMAFSTLGAVGMVPLGALASGAVASRLGEPTTVLLSGSLLLVFAVVMFLRVPEIRGLQ